mgnify:CR=1 FL=1
MPEQYNLSRPGYPLPAGAAFFIGKNKSGIYIDTLYILC